MANFNTRIKNKYDTLENWLKNDPVLLAGEIGIAVIPSSSSGVVTQPPAISFKIGDGEKKFSELSWATALAGDVYAWAKDSTKPSYKANEIDGLSDYISGKIDDTNTTYQIVQDDEDKRKFILQSREVEDTTWTNVSEFTIPDTISISTGSENGTIAVNGSDILVKGLGSAAYTDSTNYDNAGAADEAFKNAKSYTDEKVAGLTGAMHYRGSLDELPSDNSEYSSGDVIVIDSKEYVFDGTTWRELGDEGSYVLKTQTINGKELTGNITLNASDVGAATSDDIDTKINDFNDTLAAVATSGKIDDLTQTDYIIFNCGTASTII